MISFAAASRFLVLKDPALGDQKAVDVHVRIQTMMSGAVRTRRSTPAKIKFKLKFVDVTRVKTIETRDFLVATMGQQVRYVDYNSTSWIGFLTVEPNSFVTTGRGLGHDEPRKESNEFTIEFEGKKL